MVILNLQGGCAGERANATVPPGIMAFNLGVCVVGEGFMRDSWEHSHRTSDFFLGTLGYNEIYPLANCYITMGNHHRNSDLSIFFHEKWWCSIIFCMFARGYKQRTVWYSSVNPTNLIQLNQVSSTFFANLPCFLVNIPNLLLLHLHHSIMFPLVHSALLMIEWWSIHRLFYSSFLLVNAYIYMYIYIPFISKAISCNGDYDVRVSV